MATTRAIPAAALAAALFLGPAVARAGHHHHSDGFSVTTNDREPVSCSDLTIEYDDRPAERAETTRTIPAVTGKALRVEAAQNSGIWVRGSDRADFRVTLCKGAESKAALDAIRFSQGDVLSVDGPASEEWVGYLLIESLIDANIGQVSRVHLSGGLAAPVLEGRRRLRHRACARSDQECKR